jgi:23S rRNA (guanosine2251-2'-O)-methyltransferase
LSNESDREKVIALYIEKDSEKDARINEILETSKGIKRFFLEKKEFRSLVKDDARGVMLLMHDDKKNLTVKQAIERDGGEYKTVLLLNEVLYEENLGAIIRSCEAMGAGTVILANRIKSTLTPVVRRVSMGASERITIVNENLFVAIAELKRLGFKIYAVETNGESELGKIEIQDERIAFIIGGENKGVTTPLEDKCDGVIKIPMHGVMGSLNISVSVGITLYERLRQIIK